MTAPSPALRLLTLCRNVPLGVYFPFCFIIHFPILLPIWGKSSCLHICSERQSAFMYRNQELAVCQQGWVTAWSPQSRLSAHCCPQMLLEKWVPILRGTQGRHVKILAKAAMTWAATSHLLLLSPSPGGHTHSVVTLDTLQLFCVTSFTRNHLASVEEFKSFCRSLELHSETATHWQGRLSPCRKGIQFWRGKKITLGTSVGHLKLVNSNFISV